MVSVALVSVVLTACQTPRPYNGATGYEIEAKSEQSATIRYTMAKRANQSINEARLQQICQQVLGKNTSYHVHIINQQEISAPNNQLNEGVRLGESRMKVGFSNSPELHNSEGYAGRQVNETRPNSLTVVRYQCQK